LYCSHRYFIDERAAVKITRINDTTRLLVLTIASFFVIANPKGSKKTGTVIYWTSMTLIMLVTFLVEGLLAFTDEGQDLTRKAADDTGNGQAPPTVIRFAIFPILACPAAIIIYHAMVGGRRYIARHSDAQIDEHLQNYIKVGAHAHERVWAKKNPITI
jgi:hypothetical protein